MRDGTVSSVHLSFGRQVSLCVLTICLDVPVILYGIF